MDIILNREFEHAITETRGDKRQNYRILVASEVVANLFGHSELVFDTVYTLIAQDTVGYDKDPSELLYSPDSQGYGMVTTFRVPFAREMDFRQNMGRLFQAMVEHDSREYAGKESPMHYQESGSVSVYMKRFGDELWAFVIDDGRTYSQFEGLNPDEEPLPALEDMDPNDAGGIVLENHDKTVRLWGDENSDSGFNDWLYQASPALYHQLVRLDVIGRAEQEQDEV